MIRSQITFNFESCSNLIRTMLHSTRQIQPIFPQSSTNVANFDLNEAINDEDSADNFATDLNFEDVHQNFEDFDEKTNEFDDEFHIEDLLKDDFNHNEPIDEEQTHEEVSNELEEEHQNLPNQNESTSTVTNDDLQGSLVGYTTKTLEEMHELYNKHASVVGFCTRKHTTRCFTGSTKIMEKYFVCSAQGKRHIGHLKAKKDDSNNQQLEIHAKKKKRKPRQVQVTRTDCKACIRVKYNKEGLYEVIQHVMAHNHELTRKRWNFLHRSERQITKEKAAGIEQMQNSGLSAMDSYRNMCDEAGAEDCVGHTIRDHLNYCNRLKMKSIKGGDAQSLIEIMYQQLAHDPEFFFRVRLDNIGRVSSIFWRDSMMFEDYSIYGDVVVFDTTYRTNRYNLICAPIVGINNHWRNVMFGCAFIGDEKTETFVWLLETFKKSMRDKSPTTIFTDQDISMSNAISKVFPYTRHRLRIWHLEQNAILRFGQLNRDATFKDTFNKCLKKCETIEVFEKSWKEMLEKYKLSEHKWFKRVYELKEKWCPAFSKDFFSAGIFSSQRSESTNHAIGFRAKKSTSLTEFYKIFRSTIKRWRSKEIDLELKCGMSMPSSAFVLSGLLKHASEVYTASLFRDFEMEFNYAMASNLQRTSTDENTSVYKVWLENDPLSTQQVTYTLNQLEFFAHARTLKHQGGCATTH